MTDDHPDHNAETVAFALLRLVGAYPGQFGRLRCARIVCGAPIPREDDPAEVYAFAITGLAWTLRETVELVDAMLNGGLFAQTKGARPALVLTRAGHRSLDALEMASPPCAPQRVAGRNR